jgi:hypothetical protein
MNGILHKNRLALELTDVMYEKELMNQFSRVLDHHGSIGLLSIYIALSDVLNDIPLASDILVRKKLYRRLKHIDERYLNPVNSDGYIMINNPNENGTRQVFDVQQIFPVLSRFHCKIYELIEEKYQRAFLTSEEHFFYICGQPMDSPDYRFVRKTYVILRMGMGEWVRVRVNDLG